MPDNTVFIDEVLGYARMRAESYLENVAYSKEMKQMYMTHASADEGDLERMGIGIGDGRRKAFDGDKVLEIAYKYVNTNDWVEYSKRGLFRPGVPKCNIYVYEVLTAAGAHVPRMGGELGKATGGRYGYPPLAADWFAKDKEIRGWNIVSDPLPGDVVSNGVHVGLYVSRNRIISATTNGGVRESEFNTVGSNAVTIRRYTSGINIFTDKDEVYARRHWH